MITTNCWNVHLPRNLLNRSIDTSCDVSREVNVVLLNTFHITGKTAHTEYRDALHYVI